jgi:rare lipoprotein A
MSEEPRIHPSRLRRFKALRRLRIKRRHVRNALMATTPTAALLGFGTMTIPKAAAPIAIAAVLPATEAVAAELAEPAAPEPPVAETADLVEASYYGDGFAGKPTASGEIFDPELMTAAHKTLPLGTLVKVTEALSGKSVTVRINDRGPFHGDRAIDLSEGAARSIGLIDSGTGKVSLAVLGQV